MHGNRIIFASYLKVERTSGLGRQFVLGTLTNMWPALISDATEALFDIDAEQAKSFNLRELNGQSALRHNWSPLMNDPDYAKKKVITSTLLVKQGDDVVGSHSRVVWQEMRDGEPVPVIRRMSNQSVVLSLIRSKRADVRGPAMDCALYMAIDLEEWHRFTDYTCHLQLEKKGGFKSGESAEAMELSGRRYLAHINEQYSLIWNLGDIFFQWMCIHFQESGFWMTREAIFWFPVQFFRRLPEAAVEDITREVTLVVQYRMRKSTVGELVRHDWKDEGTVITIRRAVRAVILLIKQTAPNDGTEDGDLVLAARYKLLFHTIHPVLEKGSFIWNAFQTLVDAKYSRGVLDERPDVEDIIRQ